MVRLSESLDWLLMYSLNRPRKTHAHRRTTKACAERNRVPPGSAIEFHMMQKNICIPAISTNCIRVILSGECFDGDCCPEVVRHTWVAIKIMVLFGSPKY